MYAEPGKGAIHGAKDLRHGDVYLRLGHMTRFYGSMPAVLPSSITTFSMPWCTTPIEAESSLGPDSHHPIILLSGIPSAVMVLRILHPILASTPCAANPLARIAEPTIAL